MEVTALLVCVNDARPSVMLEGHSVVLPEQPAAPPGFNLAHLPDSGVEAWSFVAAGWSGLFCTFSLVHFVGVFEEYYVSGPLASYGQDTVGWIRSVQVWAMTFFGVVFGRVFDP